MIPEAKVKTGKYISWRSKFPEKAARLAKRLWGYWPIYLLALLLVGTIAFFVFSFKDCQQQAEEKRRKSQDMADSYTKYLGLEGSCTGECGNNQEDYVVCCTYFLPEQKILKFRCNESDCSIEEVSIEIKK